MKPCTATVVNGLDNKPHFAVVAVEQPAWPIALFGPTEGALAKKSEAESKFFADAPEMMVILKKLSKDFRTNTHEFVLSAGKLNELQALVEQASGLVAKHAVL